MAFTCLSMCREPQTPSLTVATSNETDLRVQSGPLEVGCYPREDGSQEVAFTFHRMSLGPMPNCFRFMKLKDRLKFFLTLRGAPRTTVPALVATLVLVTGCCSLFPSRCKPIIIQQPQSQVALQGTPATFMVVA